MGRLPIQLILYAVFTDGVGSPTWEFAIAKKPAPSVDNANNHCNLGCHMVHPAL